MLKTDLLECLLGECVTVARDAADARNSDHAALVGCLAAPDQLAVVALKQQCEEFEDLAGRLRDWQSQLERGGDDALGDTAKRELLADLRILLRAIRVAAFDVALHGRCAGLTDVEIVDEAMKYAELDSRLRGNVLPGIKTDLGVTDTEAW